MRKYLPSGTKTQIRSVQVVLIVAYFGMKAKIDLSSIWFLTIPYDLLKYIHVSARNQDIIHFRIVMVRACINIMWMRWQHL